MEILKVAIKYRGICDVLMVRASEYVRENWGLLMGCEGFRDSVADHIVREVYAMDESAK